MTTFPAGRYYVGDLCYVFDDLWPDICDYIGMADEFEVNGIQMACFPTMYGDGQFPDQFGGQYCVDSGTIGCVLMSEIEKNPFDMGYREDLACVIDFNEPFTVGVSGSKICIGHIEIETGDPEDEEFE